MLFCPRYSSEAAWFLLPQDQHGSHCLKIIVGLVASCSLGCRLGSTRGRFLFGHAFPTTTSSRTILLPRSVSAWRDTLCLGAETAVRHSLFAPLASSFTPTGNYFMDSLVGSHNLFFAAAAAHAHRLLSGRVYRCRSSTTCRSDVHHRDRKVCKNVPRLWSSNVCK